MFCENCNAPITFVSQHQKGKYYTCCSIAKRTKKSLNLCQTKLIPEEVVNNYVLNTLREICFNFLISQWEGISPITELLEYL